MAFTYDIATDRGKCRFAAQDTAAGAGILPAGANFTDAEVDAAMTLCGGWRGAAVYLLRAAATAWAKEATSKSVGGFSYSRETAARLSAQADQLEKNAPGGWAGALGQGLGQSGQANIAQVE